MRLLSKNLFPKSEKQKEGRGEREEERGLGGGFSRKKHLCKLKDQHPWKSQAQSWAPITAVPSGAKAGGLLATSPAPGSVKDPVSKE